MNPSDKNRKILSSSSMIFTLILGAIALTRFSHELTAFSLPDASLILFLAGGILLKRLSYLLALLCALFLIDGYAIMSHQYANVAFNSGYLIHLATYLFAWMTALKFLSNGRAKTSKFFTISSLVICMAYLLSYGSFFLLNHSAVGNSLYTFLMQDLIVFITANFVYLGLLFLVMKINQHIVNQNTTARALINN